MGECCSRVFEDPWEEEERRRRRKPDDRFPSSTSPVGNAAGSQVYVYKQDPLLSYIGRRLMWLPEEIRAGPATDDVVIAGMRREYKETDNSGNFLYDPRHDPDGFDAVNALTVVHHVLWMFRRVLYKVRRRKFNWLWGERPIYVYPHAGKQSNAYYSRDEKALKLFYFDGEGRTIFACRSWDIMAHETGHAVLDSLQPGWISSSNPQTGALHEAFGDVSSIFSVLDQLDMCELIIAHTKGDLSNRSNFLAALGEEFGRGVGRHYGIRNADMDRKMSQVSTEVHDLSKVFTGAVYDVLVKIFNATLHVAEYPPAETLYRAGRHLLSVFVVAVISAPYKNATFEDVAKLMIKREPQEMFKGFLRDEFGRREVFDEWVRPQPHRADFNADISHGMFVCETMGKCGLVPHSPPADNTKTASHKDVQIKTISRDNTGSSAHRDMPKDRIYLDNVSSHNGNSSQHRNVHMNYQDTTVNPNGTQSSRRNIPQNNDYLNNTSTFRGNQEQRNVQQYNIYTENKNGFKDSKGHRDAQYIQRIYLDNTSSFQGGVNPRGVSKAHTYQPSRPQRSAMSNIHQPHTLGRTDGYEWENQSTSYSDNVFDSTEI